MTILTIALLIAAVALAIISLVLNRKSAKKLESGMRTIYKHIKDLEGRSRWEITLGGHYVQEEDDDIQMDPESDPEAPEEDSGALSDSTDGNI